MPLPLPRRLRLDAGAGDPRAAPFARGEEEKKERNDGLPDYESAYQGNLGRRFAAPQAAT
eukprot:4523843-Alexandrium_andersonii.AAC.1